MYFRDIARPNFRFQKQPWFLFVYVKLLIIKCKETINVRTVNFKAILKENGSVVALLNNNKQKNGSVVALLNNNKQKNGSVVALLNNNKRQQSQYCQKHYFCGC